MSWAALLRSQLVSYDDSALILPCGGVLLGLEDAVRGLKVPMDGYADRETVAEGGEGNLWVGALTRKWKRERGIQRLS